MIAVQRCGMMGTNVIIKVQTEESELEKAHAAIEKAITRMQNLIEIVNARDPNSEVSYLNQNAGNVPVHIHAELMQILQTSRDVSVASEGAFDITFYAVGQLWKLRPVLPEIPTDEAIASALLCVGYQKMILNPDAMTAFLNKEGMRIELGAIAKGAVVDEAAQSLRDDGFTNYLINAGGDLYVTCPTGSPGWNVGLTNPVDPRGPVLVTIEMHRGSIVTSGNYEKMVEINGKRYHHIIDPRTGRPADRCISVTVIADNAMLADAYATAFFVMGPEKGMKLCESLTGIEAFFIDKELKTSCSSGFPAKELLNVEIKNKDQ
ncbi:MAG TPA: FAD:protein FMN transferase [Anaerohalosphaeraceae bacterium]|nr:FAD:protein FMN transferase [Anaerohalosphaeraceae bacterium]